MYYTFHVLSTLRTLRDDRELHIHPNSVLYGEKPPKWYATLNPYGFLFFCKYVFTYDSGFLVLRGTRFCAESSLMKPNGFYTWTFILLRMNVRRSRVRFLSSFQCEVKQIDDKDTKGANISGADRNITA